MMIPPDLAGRAFFMPGWTDGQANDGKWKN